MFAKNLFRRLFLKPFRVVKRSPILNRPRALARRIELLEDRLAPALLGLETSDQLVNSVGMTVAQGGPRIAMKPDGSGFVVVWQGPDGGGGMSPDSGIFARIYNANWQPVGNEFPVNTTLPEQQYEPAVAIDAAGNFVVVW